MTRKDFVLIASTINKMPPALTREQVANHFANALANTNANFDVVRFIDACHKA